MNRKLRMGMVGGGPGAFIGDVHRKAAAFDGGVELVSGCFSRDAAKSRAMAEEIYLDPARCHGSQDVMGLNARAGRLTDCHIGRYHAALISCHRPKLGCDQNDRAHVEGGDIGCRHSSGFKGRSLGRWTGRHKSPRGADMSICRCTAGLEFQRGLNH